MAVRPKFTKNEISDMLDQRLTMNLNNEGLSSTGSAIEKRERLLKHFYPTPHSNDPGPSAKVSTGINYSRTQINCLPIGPLKDALAALNLPFTGGKGADRATLKAALYPPPVAVGTSTQPNVSQIPSNQPSAY